MRSARRNGTVSARLRGGCAFEGLRPLFHGSPFGARAPQRRLADADRPRGRAERDAVLEEPRGRSQVEARLWAPDRLALRARARHARDGAFGEAPALLFGEPPKDRDHEIARWTGRGVKPRLGGAHEAHAVRVELPNDGGDVERAAREAIERIEEDHVDAAAVRQLEERAELRPATLARAVLVIDEARHHLIAALERHALEGRDLICNRLDV